MQNIPHYYFGRAVLAQYPEIYQQIASKLIHLKQSARQDIDAIPYLFNDFCNAHQLAPDELTSDNGRTPKYLVEKRRVFIALVLVQFDPVFMHDYSQCMKANLRRLMAEAMNVQPVWISQVTDSIRFEYYNLSTFRMQVDLMIYWLNNRQKVA